VRARCGEDRGQYEAQCIGWCTNINQAESFFSRMRRAEIGVHHRHLAAYATELAWREDARRVSNGSQFTMIVSATAAAPKSETWSGYWQRRRPD
jgi:hypothetical protein